MNFFEHSARVPLIFAGPNIASGVIKNTCSLVDILPTLIDIAGGSKDILGMEIDGRSLVNLLHGKEDLVDEAIGEYCAEMTAHPVFMIRRSNLKYIHCDEDPPQLYDLNDDPLEIKNLANHPEYKEAVARFSNEVSSRWDSKKLRQDIIKTQKSRRSLYEAMSLGKFEAWDYNPPSDASQQYVRNHMDWTIAASRYRFPPISDEKP
jgi:choline-sulfatase